MNRYDGPIEGIANISKIHEARLAYLLNPSSLNAEYASVAAVGDIIAEAALKLAQVYEMPGSKADPGRVTAVYDKLAELRQIAMSALMLNHTRPLNKAPSVE